MKTPVYESSPGALNAMFASRAPFFKVDCFTWTFVDGSILRVTDADISVAYGGNTFISCRPAMERTKVTLKVGVESDSMDITIKPDSSDTIGGLIWPKAARLGYLDGAQLLVETAYLTQWPTIVGVLHVFQGFVSDAFPERTKIRVTVKDALELLAQQFPHNVYQSVCMRTVYGAGCGVSKPAFTAAGTIAASPAPTITSFKTAHTQAAGYYDQGIITFTSGANAGLTRTVKSYSPATGFTFALPLPVAPAAGDTMTARAGCDKMLSTCRTKFNNAARFRGYPWVPTPETATPPVNGYTSKQGGK